jgi:hypothetical protein
MRSTRSVGLSLAGLWLVLTGLVSLLPLAIPGFGMLLALLAVVAGIMILAGR